MALKKLKQIKGIDAEYWAITNFQYDDISNSAKGVIALYYNQEARENKANFLFREAFKVSKIEDISTPEGLPVTSVKDLIKSMLYPKIKESRMSKEVKLDEEGNEMKDEDGKTIREDVEQNYFVDAEDC